LVALLDTPVGIDLEKPIKLTKRLCDRLLTEKEVDTFNALPENEKESYISKIWTKKESIFKFLGRGVFSPKEIESENYFTITKNLTLFNEEFLMSITTEKKASEIVFLQKDFE
jgi:phosphopantetheine--protein transferase-like protein